jgi:5-methylcytosine-specific restriction protein A
MGPLKAVLHAWRVRQSERRELQKELVRSPQWRTVRDHFLQKHVLCEACGSTERLQVHHVKPYHLFPELELDQANLLTLCMSECECHLVIGHGGDFACYNPNVLVDIVKARIAASRHALLEFADVVKGAKAARLKDEE